MGWPPPRRTKKLHPSLPTSARAKSSKTRAAKDSPSSGSQNQPSGDRRGWGRGREGRASTKCLVRGGGRSTTSSPSGGAFLVGRWEAGLPYTCNLQEPPSCSPPPGRQHGGGGVAEEQAGRRTERDNTVLACSLAHSHIKSNSFIFLHLYIPAGLGRGWLGKRGAPRRTSLAGGRRLSGEVRWWRTLCQGVPYLVLGAPAQEFSLLVCAGQRVAAAVASHVQCGVHRVREVGGLQATEGAAGAQAQGSVA